MTFTSWPLTDERIERALARTNVAPEFCEWYGGKRVIFRVETMIGQYAEVDLIEWMDDDMLVDRIEKAAQKLRDLHD